MRRESADDVLSLIEDLYDDGRFPEAQRELQRARSVFPDNLTLLEWEAVFASEEGRFLEALDLLERVLAKEPERSFALREKAGVLRELGRFEDALEALVRVGPEEEQEAHHAYSLAICQDRLRKEAEAERNFRQAARLAPAEFPRPPRLARKEFEAIVRRSVKSIPKRFQPYLKNVEFVVEDYPEPTDPDPFILGLYEGIPRTERDAEQPDHPDRVILFKRNLEIEFPERAALEEEIRKTVVHEIAHHFGLGEEEMGEYA
jgi:predicted Zn-dependent protease with MMP-like domain